MSKNYEEARARFWLECEGYTDIYDLSEDCKDPPDFVVDGCIGVEVRRLNLRPSTSRSEKDVGDLEYPLKRAIRSALDEVAGVPDEYGVYVWCDLYRDCMPKTRHIKFQVEKAAEEYISLLNEALQSAGSPVHWQTDLACGISVRFAAASPSNAGKFVLTHVAHIPPESGQVVNDAIENINRCIDEKTKKIKWKICEYSEWWLVLVDTSAVTSPSSHQDDWQQIRERLDSTAPWSRIVVITWMDGLDIVELI